MQRNRRVKGWMRARAFAIVMMAAVGGAGISAVGLVAMTSSAIAADLTAGQTAAVKASVQTAIANVNPALTGSAKAQAIAAAIAQVTKTDVAIYGAGAISVVVSAAIADGVSANLAVAVAMRAAVESGVAVSVAVDDVLLGAIAAGASVQRVTEAIIAAAAQDGYAASDVGAGLGLAATQLAQTNPDAAFEIASVVSNEGDGSMRQAFSQSVVANGGSQQLADAGSANPNAQSGPTAGGSTGTGGTATITSCGNPSCT